MQQRCYFWRGMKTHFSSLLMMLISSHSPNMQMKCAITNEWTVPRRWGRFKQDSLFAKHRRCTTLVTCCTLGACTEPQPGAVWAAVWAGMPEPCHHNHSLGLEMRLQKSKGELIWPPASEIYESYLANYDKIIISFYDDALLQCCWLIYSAGLDLILIIHLQKMSGVR